MTSSGCTSCAVRVMGVSLRTWIDTMLRTCSQGPPHGPGPRINSVRACIWHIHSRICMFLFFFFYHCIKIHISPLFLQLSVTTSASLWIFPGSVCLWLQLRWERRAHTGFFNRLKYVLEHFVIHQILNLKACSHSIKPELCPAGLPDIVVDGVLQGFYPRDIRVSFTAPILTEPDPASSIEAWNDSL